MSKLSKSVTNLSIKSNLTAARSSERKKTSPAVSEVNSVRFKRTRWETSGDVDQENNEGTWKVGSVAGGVDGLGGTGTGSHSIFGMIGRRGIQYENTYRMIPLIKFNCAPIETMIRSTLINALSDVLYDPSNTRTLSQHLAGLILDKTKEIPLRRYKYVAVVSICSLTERPAMQVCSRCLWDPDKDNFVTVKFRNNSLFSVAMLYAIYVE